MTRRLRLALVAAALALVASGCASVHPLRAIDIATASTSHLLCSAVFVSGRDPAQALREEMLPEPGMGLLSAGLRHDVDRERRAVRTRFAGGFEESARYRDGLGCTEEHGGPLTPDAVTLPPPAPARLSLPGLPPGTPDDPVVRAAIDAAFAEPASGAPLHTKAVVVLHDGRLVAERYAPDSGPDVPMHGHSLSKTVTMSLMGVLAAEGRVRLADRAPIAAWREVGDARREVTLEQLLRMSAGLPADETAGGFDLASRMWHQATDMAAFAAAIPLHDAPGTAWHYSDASYLLASRVLADAAGGGVAGTLAFAHRALFDPLGMSHVTLEFDNAGTPIGASHVYASPRDWARLGQFLLDDGRAGDTRLLPEGWLATARTRTLDSAYGMGLWLNTPDREGKVSPGWQLPGVPADAFFGRGYLGQYLVMVPSRRLVVLRLGVSHGRGQGIESVAALVGTLARHYEVHPSP